MFVVLSTVLPVFALVGIGWLARRRALLGPQATNELNRFVVYLALPALLFDVVAHAGWRELWQPAFVAAFGLAASAVFVATLAWRALATRGLTDASIDGLNAAYANTGFMGFPLLLAVLGREAMSLTLVGTLVTVCAMFAVALLLIEIARHRGGSPGRALIHVSVALIRNPLLWSPALGAVVMAVGLPVPEVVDRLLKLLGAAAPPCALVALGLFLAEPREAGRPVEGTRTAILVALKLLAQPLLTWWLATQVFDLPPLQRHAAVLLAALPTGTGPFMIARLYRRDGTTTARVVLGSTLLSVITVTSYVYWAV